MTENQSERGSSRQPSLLVRNRGEPIMLSNVQINGVSAGAGRGGDKIDVWNRLSLTSDEHSFHRIAEGLSGFIHSVARQASHSLNLKRADTVLLVIRPDDTAELWVDTAAVAMQIIPKRDMVAGSVVFESDIADITGMSFPLVQIGKEDRVVCIFREGWRFGLFFDFNPAGDLSIPDMQRDLGTLHRRMKYRDLYDAIADEAIFTRLVAAGWFPFVEILGSEFRMLANCCEAGFDLGNEEAKLVAKFDNERVERTFARWMARPHFAGKEPLLRAALNSFSAGEAVSVIKIALTEIEGILNEAYRHIYGTGARIGPLLEFAVASAEEKAGQPDTLLFPTAFGHYLKTHTFANFDPESSPGSAGSRHAVGHGAAAADSYIMVRALQALLTLDQLAFYT